MRLLPRNEDVGLGVRALLRLFKRSSRDAGSRDNMQTSRFIDLK